MNGDKPMLVDFGLTAPLVHTHTSPAGRVPGNPGGTVFYAAPERLVDEHMQADRIDTSVDVYSFAMVMFFLWTGQVRYLHCIQYTDPFPYVAQHAA